MTTAPCSRRGFTLIELLVVITIIAVLAGLTLGVSGNVRQKAAANRAKVEIAAIETALERYKIDNGDYPNITAAYSSGTLYKNNPTDYKGGTITMATDGSYTAPASPGGYVLFAELAGRTYFEGNSIKGQGITADNKTQYIELKKSQTESDASGNSYIIDPFGFAYGYYYNSAGNVNGVPNSKSLFNFVVPDIWSTAGETGAVSMTTGSDTYARYLRWVTNWGSRQ